MALSRNRFGSTNEEKTASSPTSAEAATPTTDSDFFGHQVPHFASNPRPRFDLRLVFDTLEGNRDVVSHMTRVCHWDVVPPYELICYAGMDLNNLILLTGGYAEVFLDGKRAEIIGPGSLIAGTEFFCDMRSAGSYVSLCHCEVMYVSRSKMNKIYQQYPAFYAIISVSREAARRIDEWSEMYNLVKGEEGILSPRMDALIDDSTRESASTIEARSFVLFWHRQTNKEKEARVHSKKLNFTGVGKVFLLRAGIVPEGNFVVAWELVRIVLVALLVFYHPMVQGLDACYELPIAYRVKSICDFLAFVDIYLRFHVGFYDKNGALIMHPTLTAAHYLRGQFLYDFLCALPLDNFMPFNISTSCLFYLLVVLSIVNTLATQLVFLHCNLRKDIPETEHYARCMTCTKQWTEHLPDLTSEFPVTAGRMYAYGWYIAYSLLLNNVLLLYSPIMALDKIISVAALITGTILTVLFQSMFLVRQYEKARLVIKHTQQKRSLVRFLNLSKVKKNDYMYYDQLVERCCALWWNSGLHKSLEEVVENFSECFKEEVVCRQFVPKLRMNHFFVDSSLHLLRDIVKSCKWNVVPENMTLIDYCDVLDSIYILVGGAVRVHQKRGGAQIALLEAGSYVLVFQMVGNMIEKDLRRVKYSVVTSNEVVQYLHIASTEFYRILAKHDEKLYDDIATYARTHPAFFPSKHSAEEKRAIWLEHNRGDFRNEKTEPTDIHMYVHLAFLMLVIDKDQFTFAKWPGMRGGLRTGMKWTLLLYIACGWHALYTCCLQGLLKPEEQAYTRLLVYLIDTIFPAVVILKLRLALLYGVDPKRGITRSRIIERYMSCIEGIVADAICLIPLDLVASYYISDYKIVPVFRFNKIFALIHMRTFFSSDLKEKSGRNMVRRLGYITLVILTMVHVYACVITSFNLSDGDTVSERIRTYLVNFSNFLCALAFHPGLFPTPGTTARTMVLVSFCIVLPYARALLISQIVLVLFLEAPSELPDFYDKFQHLKTMMEQRLMDPALCERTTNYLDNLWLSNEGVTVPKYFKRLPRTLVNNIYENRFLPIITRHKLFRDRNADFLRQLCGCVEPLIAFPGDTIATRGQKLGRIFWLERGAVTVVSNANRASRDVVEEYITRGGYFGTMQGLYPDIPYLYVYRAHTMSIVLSLEYKNWVHILKSFHSERNAIYGKLSNIHVKL
ncbi:hypothetical protein AAG570_004230 [Ranatra chinensis]|uniref:Cyclic nucleotide-binding domain-containing protein n=1 Tax=Ranatra chinensis TaxID=642074 RepID=A0ABD0Y361_9HEMI